MSLGVIIRMPFTVAKLFDTDADSNLVNSSCHPRYLPVHVIHVKSSPLKTDTRQAITFQGHFSLHICIGDLSACPWFTFMVLYRWEPFSRPSTETSFTDRCIHDIFTTEQKVGAMHYLLVATLSSLLKYVSLHLQKNFCHSNAARSNVDTRFPCPPTCS